jgi:hypothetical protein
MVAEPFGLTLPLSFAAVAVTELAGFVVAVGAATSVSVWSSPCVVPASLVATRR